VQVRVTGGNKRTYQFMKPDTMNGCKKTPRVLLFQMLSIQFVITLTRNIADFLEEHFCNYLQVCLLLSLGINSST